MSQAENNEHQETPSADVASESAVPKVSLLTRLRLPLMIAGGVIAALLFLLLGLGLGKAKLSLERKQYVDSVTLFNERLEARANEIKIIEQKAENLQKMHEEQKSRADALEKKLEESARQLHDAQQALAAATAAASAKVSAAPASAPKAKQYLRFGNVDCTVGTQMNSQDWQECLQQGRVKNSTAAKPPSPPVKAKAAH